MPSPSAASENAVVYCAGLRSALSLSVYVKHQTHPRRLDTRLIQCVSQSHAAVHWSARTLVRQMRPYMQRVGGRPTARPLWEGRCISYDIAISNATIYRLACWATIWSLVILLLVVVVVVLVIVVVFIYISCGIVPVRAVRVPRLCEKYTRSKWACLYSFGYALKCIVPLFPVSTGIFTVAIYLLADYLES